jgi:hypothetical protein
MACRFWRVNNCVFLGCHENEGVRRLFYRLLSRGNDASLLADEFNLVSGRN